MSLIARGRPLLRNGFINKHIYSPTVASSFHDSVTRHFAQIATSENVDREEIDRRRLPADYDPANFDPTKHRSPPSERIRKIVDEMDGLSLVEAAELSVILVGRMDTRSQWSCRSPAMWVRRAGAGGVAGAAMKQQQRPERSMKRQPLEKMVPLDAELKLKANQKIQILHRGSLEGRRRTNYRDNERIGAKVIME